MYSDKLQEFPNCLMSGESSSRRYIFKSPLGWSEILNSFNCMCEAQRFAYENMSQLNMNEFK